MQGGRSAVCVRCLFTNNTHAQLARTGAIWVAIFLPVWDTRKKIVAIQIALFSACVDTRKNSRDLNRDSNRAFLVCGNAPIGCVYME